MTCHAHGHVCLVGVLTSVVVLQVSPSRSSIILITSLVLSRNAQAT